MSVVAWEAALAAAEARLDAAEQVLATPGAAEKPTPFDAPAVAGPLPPALEARARALMERGNALRQRCEQESARIRAELQQLARRRPAMPAETGRVFESRA
jgi:hypothetical protein